MIGSKRCGIASHCAKQEARHERDNVREFRFLPTVVLHFFVLVDDGGACYFQVYYDPERKKFIRLAFNGIG